MPRRAKSICRHPACGAAIDAPGYCATHLKARHQQDSERRGTAYERGYTSQWAKARAHYLRAHPLCACDDCDKLPLPKVATVVDHITPHRLKEAMDSGDPVAIERARTLFWDSDNWQPMAKQCHDRKTAMEDGGFGRSANR